MMEPSRVIGLHFKSTAAAAACAHSLPERVIPKIGVLQPKKLITEKLFCFYDCVPCPRPPPVALARRRVRFIL